MNPGDSVRWVFDDRHRIWTLQPGPCSEGPQYVHITAPGTSAVVRKDELRLI